MKFCWLIYFYKYKHYADLYTVYILDCIFLSYWTLLTQNETVSYFRTVTQKRVSSVPVNTLFCVKQNSKLCQACILCQYLLISSGSRRFVARSIFIRRLMYTINTCLWYLILEIPLLPEIYFYRHLRKTCTRFITKYKIKRI